MVRLKLTCITEEELEARVDQNTVIFPRGATVDVEDTLGNLTLGQSYFLLTKEELLDLLGEKYR